MPKKHLRKGYFREGNFIRGTVVKPKHFRKKLVVDLDFHTKTKFKPSGKLAGRITKKKGFEKVPVIRDERGVIVGRAKRFKSPYPKTYPIYTKIKKRFKRKNIQVIDW